jgi:hypothetical protein
MFPVNSVTYLPGCTGTGATSGATAVGRSFMLPILLRLGMCYAFCGPVAAMRNGAVKQWSPAGAGRRKMNAQEARDAR